MRSAILFSSLIVGYCMCWAAGRPLPIPLPTAVAVPLAAFVMIMAALDASDKMRK
jgi:hypothetical protein